MKKEKNIGSISTFLGADSRIEGTIEFKGTIRHVWTKPKVAIHAEEVLEVLDELGA